VNVKWYPRRQGLIDVSASDRLDNYLVLVGPPFAPKSSGPGTRPWQSDVEYLFDLESLSAELIERG
jgi:hypothetical protein